jgi:Winged helix-turn helix
MARGRRTSLTIHLTAQERRILLAWQWSKTISAGHARRGQVIILLADRVPISQIASRVGMSRRFVYKWVQRFLQEGLAGLTNKPGRGRRRRPRPPDMFDQHDKDVG